MSTLGPRHTLHPRSRGTLEAQASLSVDNRVIATAIFQMMLPSNKQMPGTTGVI